MQSLRTVLKSALIIMSVCSATPSRANAQTFSLPMTDSPYVFCRSGVGFDIARCLNQIVANKTTAEEWLVRIKPGRYSLKNNIVIHSVQNLTIEGEADTQLGFPNIYVGGLPKERNVLQYFSIIVADSKNIKIRKLKLFGENLQAQRAMTICPTPGNEVRNLELSYLTFKDFTTFTVLVGNGLSETHLEKAALLKMPDAPAHTGFINKVKNLSAGNRFCGGDVHGLQFANNTVFMKSVGFYLVPPTGKLTSGIAIDEPRPRIAPPLWYQNEEATAGKYTEIVIQNNRFLNDLHIADSAEEIKQLKANGFHSALKLHHSKGTRVINNYIDGGSSKNIFSSGAAINIAPGMYGLLVEGNTIKLAKDRPRYPHGIGILSGYLSHTMYGIGDKGIFGALSRITIRNNKLSYAKVRFADCCVQEGPTAFNSLPYCRERDQIVRDHIFHENIRLEDNWQNGLAKYDGNLIFKSSRDEKAWVDYWKEQEKLGLGAIYCRTTLGVYYKTIDGHDRPPN